MLNWETLEIVNGLCGGGVCDRGGQVPGDVTEVWLCWRLTVAYYYCMPSQTFERMQNGRQFAPHSHRALKWILNNPNLAVTANQHVDYCALWIIKLIRL